MSHLANRTLPRLGALTVGAMLITGIGPLSLSANASTKAPIVIGYAAPALVGGQAAILAGFEKYAAAKGWKVHVVEDSGNPATQVYQIETLATEGVKAIVTTPSNSRAVCPAIAKATSLHVPVFTIDRGVVGCKVVMTVESNNTVGGEQAGQAMVRLLTQRYGSPKGLVLEVTGNLSQNVALQRGAGFNEVVKKYPGIKVITKDGNWDAATGATIVREVATAYPKLAGIYLQSDAVYISDTLASLKSIHRLYKVGQKGHIIIVSVDGSPAGVQAIRQGWSDMAAAQPLPDDGIIANYMAMTFAGRPILPGTVTQKGALWSPGHITKGPNGMLLQLSTTPVTKANANLPGLWANQK